MANLAKLEFKALSISGDNYLSWQLDAKIHLQSKRLGDAITEENDMSMEDKASALIFLRHHIHEDLKNEYLTEEDPLGLWQSLKDRYDHQKMVILPNAQSEWLNLRFQDYSAISDYNSALFNIVSRLRLCGERIADEQMIEKTLSTFHASNVLLQQQYRERRFSKYSELITCLLVAEQNSKVLIKNHNARPTGSVAVPEANANFRQNRGRGKGRGRGRGRIYHPRSGDNYNRPRRGGYTYHPRRGGYNNSFNRGGYNHYPNRGGYNNNRNFKNHQNVPTSSNKTNQNLPKDVCNRCGRNGHWSRACRAPQHVVDQYNASIETNMLNDEGFDPLESAEDVIHLECNDFCEA